MTTEAVNMGFSCTPRGPVIEGHDNSATEPRKSEFGERQEFTVSTDLVDVCSKVGWRYTELEGPSTLSIR
jgi:hypothetical protein